MCREGVASNGVMEFARRTQTQRSDGAFRAGLVPCRGTSRSKGLQHPLVHRKAGHGHRAPSTQVCSVEPAPEGRWTNATESRRRLHKMQTHWPRSGLSLTTCPGGLAEVALWRGTPLAAIGLIHGGALSTVSIHAQKQLRSSRNLSLSIEGGRSS